MKTSGILTLKFQVESEAEFDALMEALEKIPCIEVKTIEED